MYAESKLGHRRRLQGCTCERSTAGKQVVEAVCLKSASGGNIWRGSCPRKERFVKHAVLDFYSVIDCPVDDLDFTALLECRNLMNRCEHLRLPVESLISS